MTPEQYAASQAAITAGLAAYVQRVARLFVAPVLSLRDWFTFLEYVFPEVQRRYEQSATLGRDFYDSQRGKFHPGLERNERLLSELRFEQFVENMTPARKGMSQADSSNAAVSRAALTAVREVEMAARRQIIGAVKNDSDLQEQVEESADPSGRSVVGWARVATGRETCAWCLMLISRGAELNHKGNFAYAEAATAGINLDDETALDLWNEAGGDLDKFRELLYDEDQEDETYMEKWHTGCDCLAVPVFDLNDWPGRDQAKRALQLWIDASGTASELIASGKARTNNKNTETLNALRRRLERGDLSMTNYAIAA